MDHRVFTVKNSSIPLGDHSKVKRVNLFSLIFRIISIGSRIDPVRCCILPGVDSVIPGDVSITSTNVPALLSTERNVPEYVSLVPDYTPNVPEQLRSFSGSFLPVSLTEQLVRKSDRFIPVMFPFISRLTHLLPGFNRFISRNGQTLSISVHFLSANGQGIPAQRPVSVLHFIDYQKIFIYH